MHLKQLQINGFRNLCDTQITPVCGVNLITGENASGKTSLLESIYYLGHVRSFRTKQVADLINRDAEQLQLFARINSCTDKSIPIGIKRSRESLEVRADQKPVLKISDIAERFPVLAIHPDSYRLITGSPGDRRQYLDWGVFHVEHGFFSYWQRYKRALAQRNAALKSKQKDVFCDLWDKELAEAAQHIDFSRQSYITRMKPYFSELTDRFFPDQTVAVEYKRGWPTDESLVGLLTANLAKDRSKGFTYYGPHRADLAIKVNGHSAQTGISRGQQKTLVALLRLAQAKQFTQATEQPCVLLYDDLAAELDEAHKAMILSVLGEMQLQLFLTAIEPEQIDLSAWKNKKKFHVEQGKLQEMV